MMVIGAFQKTRWVMRFLDVGMGITRAFSFSKKGMI